MRKIKDFFYDKNDIIIVLIILAAAAFIIYTRIGAIMDYPEVLAEKAAATTTEASASDASSSSETKASTSTKSTSDGSASGTVSITIDSSDSAVTVAEKLYAAGLVKSDTEFEGYVSNMGQEGSIKAGTFQIPKGSSNEKILNIITQ